jgi:hypothetical protein
MNTKSNTPQTKTARANKKPFKRLLRTVSFGLALAVGLSCTRWVWAQTAPVLQITPSGTNEFSIWFTNNIGTQTYDILSTPVLANPDFPWQWAAVGSPGQTNFLVTGTFETEFYQAILDTNAVPLWEAANPTNASLGILSVFIDSPTNGAVLQ